MKRIFTTIAFIFCISTTNLFAQGTLNGSQKEGLMQLFKAELSQLKQTYNDNAKFTEAFTNYYNNIFTTDKQTYCKLVIQNKLNATQAKTYMSKLSMKYDSMHAQFVALSIAQPNVLTQYSKKQGTKQAFGTCNSAPTNISFTSGTLNSWNAYYAYNESGIADSVFDITSITGGPCGAVTGAANDPITNTLGSGFDYQVSIVGAGTDPLIGQPMVSPGISPYAVRIGDSTNPGSGVAILNQTFVVTAAYQDFSYLYELVIENPGVHPYYDKPFFLVTFLDANKDTIPCGSFFVNGMGNSKKIGIDSVYYATNADYVYYTHWQGNTVFLKKYLGQCITVQFEVADCSPGAHFCYAYVQPFISNPEIISSGSSICNKPLTLTAPSNMSGYKWMGPAGGISGSDTTQTITIKDAGTYSVIVNPLACSDTFSINIPSGNGSVKSFFSSLLYCLTSQDYFSETPTSGSSPYSFAWSSGETTSAVNGLPAGGPYSVTVTDANGCSVTDTFSVYQSSFNPEITSGQKYIMAGDSAPLTIMVNGPSDTITWTPSASVTSPNSASTYAHPITTTTYTASTHTFCGIYTDTVTIHITNCTNNFNQQVCLVTTDTATNKNVILWGRNNSPPDGWFNIYDSTSTGWNLLARIADTSLSEYVDASSNPESRSYSYKLSTLDSCGESALSITNSSIYLQVFQNGSTNTLNWTPYIGFSATNYLIYRGPSLHSLTLIDSVAGSVYSYIDNSAPAGYLYLIEVINPSGSCIPTKKAIGFNSSALLTNATFSNGGIPVIITGVNTNTLTNNITIYPVPTSGKLNIQLTAGYGLTANSFVLIYDITGRQVAKQNTSFKHNTETIDVTSLANGTYILILSDGKTNSQAKFTVIH